jgi:23S rRNA (adenine2503-C2)-methyltransferase
VKSDLLLPNLYDLAPDDLHKTLSAVVSPPFRARQIEEWMHLHGVDSFDVMTNIPKEVREQLAARYTLAMPDPIERTTPAADGSQKYLFVLRDGNRIESVYMPMGERTSICLSSRPDARLAAPSA